MDNLEKEATRKTPKVLLNSQSGEFVISGHSYPDNAYDFYKEIYDWLDKYIEVPLSSTKLSIEVDYFNSSTYKCFLEIIRKLENIQDANHEIEITWIYDKEDEENREAGEDLKELTMLDIEIRESETSSR